MIDRKSFLHDVFVNNDDDYDDGGGGRDVFKNDDHAYDADVVCNDDDDYPYDADVNLVYEVDSDDGDDDDDDGDVVCDDGPSSSIKVDKVIAGLDQSPPVLNNDLHRKTSCRIQEMHFQILRNTV